MCKNDWESIDSDWKMYLRNAAKSYKHLETWALNSKASELKMNYGLSLKDHSKFLMYMGINDTLKSFTISLP